MLIVKIFAAKCIQNVLILIYNCKKTQILAYINYSLCVKTLTHSSNIKLMAGVRMKAQYTPLIIAPHTA